MGARTVRHDTGEPLSGGLIIWRQLLRLFGTVAWLDAVFIIRDDRRTLHDLLASSVVVMAPKYPNPIRFFSDEVLGVKREVS